MAVDVVMPQMGESIFEGTITKWLKKPGDKVERDEPLFEISTDKVDAEIPSPSAGVLKEIKIPEGQTVPIQTVVAVIDGAGSAAASASPASLPAPAAAKPAPAPPALLRHLRNAAPPAPAPAAPAQASTASARGATCRRHGHRAHSLVTACPPARQGTRHRSHLARRHRRRRPHHQRRHGSERSPRSPAAAAPAAAPAVSGAVARSAHLLRRPP